MSSQPYPIVTKTQPTFYFVGVTTTRSAIMRVFPRWMEALGKPEVVIEGIDRPIPDTPEAYRRTVAQIKYDPLSLGGLVTTHKIDLLEAARGQLLAADRDGSLRDETAAVIRRIAELRRAERERDHDAQAAARTLASREGERARQDDAGQEASDYAERLRRIRVLVDRGLYELALVRARALVRDHPGHPEAEELYAGLLDRSLAARRLEGDERARWLNDEVIRRIEASLIPEGIDGYPIYPTDWRARRSDATLHGSRLTAPEVEDWQRALNEQLATRVSVDARGQDGIQVLRFLAQQAGINLVIAPAVTAGGERPVTLKARDMRLDNAIGFLCEQMGVAWSLARGAVFIGEGRFRAEVPPGEFEIENVRRMLKAERVESDFKTAVLRFTDDTFDVIGRGAGPGTAPPEASRLAQEFEKRVLKETGANIAVRLTLSIVNQESPGFFMAEFDKGQRKRFTLLLDAQGRVPSATFSINGGEKGMLYAYRDIVGGGNDVWMAFYSEADYVRRRVEYSDAFDLVDTLNYDMEVDLRDPGRRELQDEQVQVAIGGRVIGP